MICQAFKQICILTLNLLLKVSLQELAQGPALPAMKTMHQEEARYPESIARGEMGTECVVPCQLRPAPSNS